METKYTYCIHCSKEYMENIIKTKVKFSQEDILCSSCINKNNKSHLDCSTDNCRFGAKWYEDKLNFYCGHCIRYYSNKDDF